MAVKKFLRLQASGDYVPNTLPGEIWECTVNLALVFGSIDMLGVLPDNYEPVAIGISRVETDWDITGNWFIPGPSGNVFNPDDYLNDQAAPAWVALMAATDLSNQVRLRTLKLSVCGAPKGVEVPAIPFAHGSPCLLEWTGSYPTGGGSGTQLPPQDSIALSWQTMQVGRRGKGRIYLPSATSAALSQAKISSSAITDIGAAGVAFLEALAIVDAIPDHVNVKPIVTGAPYSDYGVIKQVKVGNIMDTQRRRRDRLTEVYTTSAVSY